MHNSIGSDEGRNNVKNLSFGSPVRVEDSVVESTGKGSLTVSSQGIRGDTLLLDAA